MEVVQPCQIIILRATPVFYAFLLSQVPEEKLPAYDLLNVDNTAYLIPYNESDEKTLDQIEQHFPTLFSYEVRRWLGKNADNEITQSFSDFICFFRLEFHTYVFSMKELERSDKMCALLIKPKKRLLDYIRKAHSHAVKKEDISLMHIQDNSSILLIKLDTLEDISDFAFQNYLVLADLERKRLSLSSFPKINTYTHFREYFSLSIHQRISLLCEMTGKV